MLLLITLSGITLEGQELKHFVCTEKTQASTDIEEPTSEGGSAKDASEKLQLKKKKEKKRKRSEHEQTKIEEQLGSPVKKRNGLLQIKTEQQLGVAEKIQVPASEECCPQRWLASYSLLLEASSSKKKMCKGSILLDVKKNCFLLHSDEKKLIDSISYQDRKMYPGLVVEFPCYKAKVGERIAQFEEDLPLLTFTGHRTKKEMRDEKDRKRLKKKNRYKKIQRSPQAILLRSSIGIFARLASLRKEMFPRAQRSKLESPSIPNVTAHFPSPNLPHAAANSTRFRPRKLKSKIWKEFTPMYEDGKLVEGQCKHCNEVFPSSKASGTNHIHRHLKKLDDPLRHWRKWRAHTRN
jgi:hypothetical protein